jgi:DNA-binding MarR family transcriptional regulator
VTLGISLDQDSKDVDYDIDDENFLRDFLAFSRDNQVLNEEQAAVVQMGIATGFLKSHEYFTSLIVTGSASSGKSHMLDNVSFEALQYADDVDDIVYELTGGSDQAGINDPEIDESDVLYFHELQKIPDEMLEFIKTIAEDGTFRYGRSQADQDAEGGFSTEHVERDPAPVVFSFADENQAAAGKDQELRSRTVEVKVDEGPEKNAAVHDMKWGGSEIEIDDADHNYIRDGSTAEARAHAVKAHIRDAPTDVDVTIPYGNGDFEGDDWTAADVVKPMFNFGRSESTRASANLAGLTMGSAMLNYHARDSVCESCGERFGPDESAEHAWECPECADADLRIIANETDVGNLIACRRTLLATTHGLTEKKFAVLNAIRERGGQANRSGTAVQATKQDIIDEIQDNDEIATLTKPEINTILEELDEALIINIKDNPQDRRENLYVYDGSEVFRRPNLADYADRFRSVTDPIREQHISVTVDEQLDELNAATDISAFGNDTDVDESDTSGDLSDFDDSDGPSLSDDAQATADRISGVLDGVTIPQDVFEANSLKVSHMVGDTPIERDGTRVRPERPPETDDRVEGFLAPTGPFADADGFDEVEDRVTAAIEELRAEGVMLMEETDDGVAVSIDR